MTRKHMYASITFILYTLNGGEMNENVACKLGDQHLSIPSKHIMSKSRPTHKEVNIRTY